MPRRVLLMVSSMEGGGSERQTLMLLRHLDRQQFTPVLGLLHRSGSLLDQVPGDVDIHSYGSSSRPGGHLRFSIPGRILRDQIRWLTALLKNESIDVVYDRTFHMTMIAGPACNRLKIPRISTIVSPPEQALPSVESKFVQVKRWRLARAYRQAKAVVAVSKAAARSAARYYALHADSIVVIPNGIEISAMESSGVESIAGSGDRLKLVCVGRMTSEKGQVDLLQAIERISDSIIPIHLQFIGDGPQRDLLQQQAARFTGRHEVSFVGAVDDPLPLIAAADALVLPSRFEGMPNVVLEAMVLGIPVIATRAGGTADLEHDQPTIQWAEANHPPSLAAAIKAFATDRESAAQRVGNAIEMVRQHHDLRQTTRRIQELLA